MSKRPRKSFDVPRSPPDPVLPECGEKLVDKRDKAKPKTGDVICPICLISASLCPTCEKVQNLRFADDPRKGITKSQALFLMHKAVCDRCRRPHRNCWQKAKLRKECVERVPAAQDKYPHWFKPEELRTEDRDYVL